MKNICACFYKIGCRGSFCPPRPYKSCPLMRYVALRETGAVEGTGKWSWSALFRNHVVSIGDDSKEGSGCSVLAQESAEKSCILGLMEYEGPMHSYYRALCRGSAMAALSRQEVKHRLIVRGDVGDGANMRN